MKTILFLLQKEFLQVLRNKTLLPLIIAVPVVQLIILVNAATFEMKRIDFAVVDMDLSSLSRQLISRYEASTFYHFHGNYLSVDEAEKALFTDEAEIIIVIPPDFERNLIRDNTSSVQFLINAIDGTSAGLINAYSSGILADFNKDIRAEWTNTAKEMASAPLRIHYRFWYNAELEYKIYMLPGILVILVTIMGMFLTALNIVREKEMGTIEQINVTPIKKYQFIIGKLLPFMIIALFEFAFGLLIGKLLFNQPIVGSLFVLFVLVLVYLTLALGLGLLLSAISNTQQQVMFTIFFFLIVFILMSGIFTPVESMPKWAQYFNVLNPFKYFMNAIRMVMLKGSGLFDISKDLFALGIYGIIALSLATWQYRKTV